MSDDDAPSVDEAQTDTQHYARLLAAIQDAQTAEGEGRAVDRAVLAVLPILVSCPYNRAHKAAVPLCVGALAGCLSLTCEGRRGILRYGEVATAIRYVLCTACLYWTVMAHADGSGGATIRLRARCCACQHQPAQSLNPRNSRVTHQSPSSWMVLDDNAADATVVSLFGCNIQPLSQPRTLGTSR